MSKVQPDAESALQGLLKDGMTIAAGGDSGLMVWDVDESG